MTTTPDSAPDPMTDLTFFTNTPQATLLDRFKKILHQAQFFDVIVGYFRISGFHQLDQELENIEKIRILVGLSVDHQTFDAFTASQSQIRLDLESHQRTQQHITEQVIQELERSEDSRNTETGIQKFIDLIQRHQLEIKAYPSANLHAKVYISRFGPNDRDFGRVITGSSNFSWSGLVANREFNVELKNSADVQFALAQFEALWAEAVDLSAAYVETIQQKTWLNETITPYELYLKFLYEYLQEEINLDEEELEIELPSGFMELVYQKQAVTAARRILETYGGVFLADVVGLGKTYISALLAQQLQGRILIICPPVLQDYWQETFYEFGIRGFRVESLGKLEELKDQNLDRYKYVLIDEAHRFRNEATQAYGHLSQICAGRRVILVSATPLNNKIGDIFNQLKLFQAPRKSTIPGISNLEKFFHSLDKQLNQFSKNEPDEGQALQQVSQAIRSKVLRYVMVRRTRSEISRYYGRDLQEQGLSFPQLADPCRIIYQFDEQTDRIFNQTIRLLKRFSYARYMPLLYLDQEVSRFTQQAQRNIGGFMKSILVKRLESSFYAFQKTLGRFIQSYEQFIKMYEGGVVLIGKDMDVYELLERDDADEILRLIEADRLQQYAADAFHPEFIDQLRSDLALLQDIQRLWQQLDQDPKLAQIQADLQNHPQLQDQKLIIFTESKETGDYLYQNLDQLFPQQVLFYASDGGICRDGQESVKHNPKIAKTLIQRNFDPKHPEPADQIRILITTDVLAEGINLHRAGVLINYDLPWNPTRILQRVGRINRVGTPHDHIYIFNCFPTAQSEAQLGLEANIIAKIQAFHETLGEDAKYLSETEEVRSHELFGDRLYRDLTQRDRYDQDPNAGERSELEYLQLLRQIRDQNPDLFAKIKALPRKARTARNLTPNTTIPADTVNSGQLLTFFRDGAVKKFFLATEGSPTAQELDFFGAVDLLQCEPDTPRQPIPATYYDLLQRNKDEFSREEQEAEVVSAGQKSGSSHDSYMIKLLRTREMRKFKGFTDVDDQFLQAVRSAFEAGRIPKPIAKKTQQAVKPIATEPLKVLNALKKTIPPEFLTPAPAQAPISWTSQREVVLSAYCYDRAASAASPSP